MLTTKEKWMTRLVGSCKNVAVNTAYPERETEVNPHDEKELRNY
jgi:hypothetical protein